MWLLFLLIACSSPTVPDTGLDIPRVPAWPARNAPLDDPEVLVTPSFGIKRIAIDPGHGTRTNTNTGTRTLWCEDEDDMVLSIAEDLATRLRATGAFEVMLTREGPDGPSYRHRLAAVTACKADALVSLHLDARGRAWRWHPSPGQTC